MKKKSKKEESKVVSIPKIKDTIKLSWYLHCVAHNSDLDISYTATVGPVESQAAAIRLQVIHEISGKYTSFHVNRNSSYQIKDTEIRD